MDRTLNSTMCY
ncbi:hypothetical protein MAR_019159 [Mya arenaria]|uniref:Uncharacterized protein n=1 Tax=Mya arenaria TaxID=6604 RepID=A0ABY7EKB3_MYAAR|nr:hypothetical protein MAR_019159 [Mya arenaria]